MNFIQPSIDPVLFSISFIDVRWYSLAYIFGLLFGHILIKKLNSSKGEVISNNIIDKFFLWAFFGVILGGRIGYVIFYQANYFINNPIYVFEIWKGGMSFHGGLIGVIISTYVFSKLYKIKFFYLSDLISVVAPIGLFLGRTANFINTELIGRPTDFFISVIYPSVDNIKRHPSQLYEALFEGLILFIILFYFFYKKNNLQNYGFISGLFLAIYSFFRFSIEFLREPDPHLGLFYNLFSMGQILCMPIFIFGIILIKYNGYKNKN